MKNKYWKLMIAGQYTNRLWVINRAAIINSYHVLLYSMADNHSLTRWINLYFSLNFLYLSLPLLGKVFCGEDPVGSKGLLKWKGVMFAPDDNLRENPVEIEDEPRETESKHREGYEVNK